MATTRRRWLHLSLRTKLAISLSFAALIPLFIVSAIGIRVALGRAERGLMSQAEETSQIALNLLLRQVQRIGIETASLAGDPELHELMALESALITTFLETYYASVIPALVEVVGHDRRIIARYTPGNPERFEGFASGKESLILRRALSYQRTLTVSEREGRLVIQAASPIVDSSFVLQGAVLITSPLDEQMAEFIKGVVRADVGFFKGNAPLASTFTSAQGKRVHGLKPPPLVTRRVMEGASQLSVQNIAGQEYAMAYAPLQNVAGERIGMMTIGLSREGLRRAQTSAIKSVLWGAVASLLFILLFAYVVGTRITTPLIRLHRSARAIAAGDLESRLVTDSEDEIGDLARAFQSMTRALQEHQQRLAARVGEISTLHQIGRAVSSVLSLDEVLRLVLTEVTKVLGAERGALLLRDEEGGLKARTQVGLSGEEDQIELPERWSDMAADVLEKHTAKVDRSILAVPLETRDRVVGALVVTRRESSDGFSEGDLRLVVTFADQAATAIENARLYRAARVFSEELEQQVQTRTQELRTANKELAHTISELQETQAMLIHADRMAGLGLLVAGVAHEINTPAGAIQGSAQVLGSTLQRLVDRLQRFMGCGLSSSRAAVLFDQMRVARTSLAQVDRTAPADMRRRARELGEVFEGRGVDHGWRLAKRLLEAGAGEMVQEIAALSDQIEPELVVGIVEDLSFLERSSLSIQVAISSLVQLVRALKRYAHTDQEAVVEADLTEGLETTLTILHNQLRYGINVTRCYGELPRVRAYVDELNQVWTNLINNSVQAMDGKGEITIETSVEGQWVAVKVTDNGPGIPQDVLPRIFDPFFTTKLAGEGSGLGLGIAKRIVDKHGGRIEVSSRPGQTTFSVLLPVKGPPSEKRVQHAEG